MHQAVRTSIRFLHASKRHAPGPGRGLRELVCGHLLSDRRSRSGAEKHRLQCARTRRLPGFVWPRIPRAVCAEAIRSRLFRRLRRWLVPGPVRRALRPSLLRSSRLSNPKTQSEFRGRLSRRLRQRVRRWVPHGKEAATPETWEPPTRLVIILRCHRLHAAPGASSGRCVPNHAKLHASCPRKRNPRIRNPPTPFRQTAGISPPSIVTRLHATLMRWTRSRAST